VNVLDGLTLGGNPQVSPTGEFLVLSDADLSVADGVTTPAELTFGTTGPLPAISQTALTALCFLTGTRIATPSGETPVECLSAGDLVLTASGAVRPITWAGVGQVLAARGRRTAATPVIVHKGALGPNVPWYDLRVTKGHSFYIDGVLIPVEFLVNHRSIRWDDRAREVKLYHIELDTHDVLLANGAPAESYRDDGNRWLFQNANAGWDQPPKPPCAPVLTGGPLVDAVWRRLLDRAGPRPGMPLTADPDVHLRVDGCLVYPKESINDDLVFHLPAAGNERSVHIVSRAAAPDQLGIARDPRELGVALRSVTIRNRARCLTIDSADDCLAEGFHGFEPESNLRWTNGDAALPQDLFSGFDGCVDIVLSLGGSTQYVAGSFRRRAA
jgi:hypothetical protein